MKAITVKIVMSPFIFIGVVVGIVLTGVLAGMKLVREFIYKHDL